MSEIETIIIASKFCRNWKCLHRVGLIWQNTRNDVKWVYQLGFTCRGNLMKDTSEWMLFWISSILLLPSVFNCHRIWLWMPKYWEAILSASLFSDHNSHSNCLQMKYRPKRMSMLCLCSTTFWRGSAIPFFAWIGTKLDYISQEEPIKRALQEWAIWIGYLCNIENIP